MDNTTDTLQIRIDQSMARLPKENREAISTIDWRTIIQGMRSKYNDLQLENLELETELLLSGILEPESYPKELENRMKISESEANVLVNEMDKLIFQKIQDELIKRTGVSESIILDPRFTALPQNIQEAIAKSSWQRKLYEIGTKNKLSIDKMAILEDITVQVILGKILPSIYESELGKAMTGLDRGALKSMIEEINSRIMKVIRQYEQQTKENGGGDVKDIDDEVPIPPYAKEGEIKIDVPLIPKTMPQVEKVEAQPTPLTKIETGIYNNAGIEVVEGKKDDDLSKSIIGSKLSGVTTSKPTISDYSLPKVNTQIPPIPPPATTSTSPGHDPYHETIE